MSSISKRTTDPINVRYLKYKYRPYLWPGIQNTITNPINAQVTQIQLHTWLMPRFLKIQLQTLLMSIVSKMSIN